MKSPSDIILAEIGDVKQVVHAACAVESALRGAPVDPHDSKVQVRAAEIILSGVGAQMRSVIGNGEPGNENGARSC